MKIIQNAFGQRKDTSNIKVLMGPRMSIVFKQRLAYYFWFYNVVGASGYGSKTIAEQAALYLGWIQRKPGFNQAAYPGQSKHQFDIAWDENDVNGVKPATMPADFLLPPEKQTLAKFGLYLPFWKGNGGTQENWHLQPIEYLGYTGDPKDFLDFDDLVDSPSGHRRIFYEMPVGWTNAPVYMAGADVSFVQRAVGMNSVGGYGPKSAAAVAVWRVKNGLSNIGVVDDEMWNLLLKPAPVMDYKSLYESLKVGCDALQTDLVSTKNLLVGMTTDRDNLVSKVIQIQDILSR